MMNICWSDGNVGVTAEAGAMVIVNNPTEATATAANRSSVFPQNVKFTSESFFIASYRQRGITLLTKSY
jgi:uncharacterized protein (AIM24 family)